MNVSTEDVRKIAQQVNQPLEKIMLELTDTMKKTGETLNELLTQNRVNEERYVRVYQLADQNSKDLLKITIDRLPEIEKIISNNTLGFKILLKIAMILFVPTATLFGLFYKMQTQQTKVIADAIVELGKVIGN